MLTYPGVDNHGPTATELKGVTRAKVTTVVVVNNSCQQTGVDDLCARALAAVDHCPRGVRAPAQLYTNCHRHVPILPPQPGVGHVCCLTWALYLHARDCHTLKFPHQHSTPVGWKGQKYAVICHPKLVL